MVCHNSHSHYFSETPCSFCGCLQPLLKSPRAGQSCFLGVTALVHRFCSAHSSCGVVPAVQSVMRTLGKFLGGNCTVQDPEHLSKVLTVQRHMIQAFTFLFPLWSRACLMKMVFIGFPDSHEYKLSKWIFSTGMSWWNFVLQQVEPISMGVLVCGNKEKPWISWWSKLYTIEQYEEHISVDKLIF